MGAIDVTQRNLNTADREALYAETTDQIWLMLLTITTSATTFHLVNNNEDVTSNGQVFQWYPFAIGLPEQNLDQTPSAQLTIGNVDQLLVDTLRQIDEPPTFKIQLVRADAPDHVEVEINDLVMRQVSWDASTITATLTLDDVFNAPFPAGTGVYSPRQFPGMFT